MKQAYQPAYIDPSTKNRPSYYSVIEVTAVSVFAVFMTLFAYKLITAVGAFDFTVVTLILGLVLPVFGYILADFFSGFVHFLGDTFGNEEIPFFGPNFIRPFRSHHIDEKEITRHKFLEVNGTNCLVSLFVLIPVYFFLPVMSSFAYFFAGEVIWFLILSVFLTNQIHKWAHLDNPPQFVRFLQRYRLILSPDHHQVHHTAPFATYYCITSGWLNAILAKLRFFDSIAKVFHAKPPEKRMG